MKALILAAGVGDRLASASNQKPKCLLSFNGTTLLQRHVDNLFKHGVKQIDIITGYQSGAVLEELDSHTPSGMDINTIYNKDYLQGSIVSLWHGKGLVESGDDILLMDADVLYTDKIISRLINSSYPNCFLLDRDFEAGDEPVKLCVRDGQLIEFRKQIDKNLKFDFQGESVGFFRFSAEVFALLMAQIRIYLDKQQVDAPYEEVIRDVLLKYPEKFAFEDVTGLPWIEIDFPEDIARAETEILPAIKAEH